MEIMTEKQQLIINLRMQLATLRQLLRDASETMTEQEINTVLDRISLILKVLESLEKE